MTWAAAALTVVAAALAVALVVVTVTLLRTLRSLRAVIDDLNREAVPLLAGLEGDARKASQGLDRVGDLVGAAESVTEEIVRDEPGQEVVLDRLLDLLLVAALRTWFSRAESDAPAWYRAQADPLVGRALRMLHNNPAHPWTVATLAAAVGSSRAALARRFTELVGEPPMSFLTGWRLALAADLLREPDATVAAVARQVGYGSAFALSTAFKRVRGVTPSEHRAASVPTG